MISRCSTQTVQTRITQRHWRTWSTLERDDSFLQHFSRIPRFAFRHLVRLCSAQKWKKGKINWGIKRNGKMNSTGKSEKKSKIARNQMRARNIHRRRQPNQLIKEKTQTHCRSFACAYRTKGNETTKGKKFAPNPGWGEKKTEKRKKKVQRTQTRRESEVCQEGATNENDENRLSASMPFGFSLRWNVKKKKQKKANDGIKTMGDEKRRRAEKRVDAHTLRDEKDVFLLQHAPLTASPSTMLATHNGNYADFSSIVAKILRTSPTHTCKRCENYYWVPR